MDYRHSNTRVYLLNYHIVWCPKRRRKVLVGDIKSRLKAIITEVATERQCDVLALEVMPDHVHLFLSTPPSVHAGDVIKQIKGRSSHHLRSEYPELLKMPSLWTRSYFISTAGNVSSETIRNYIAAQSTK